jgi:hypothetical protein
LSEPRKTTLLYHLKLGPNNESVVQTWLGCRELATALRPERTVTGVPTVDDCINACEEDSGNIGLTGRSDDRARHHRELALARGAPRGPGGRLRSDRMFVFGAAGPVREAGINPAYFQKAF